MPTIVGILTFMSRINFVLSWVEHKKFYILGTRPPQKFHRNQPSNVHTTRIGHVKLWYRMHRRAVMTYTSHDIHSRSLVTAFAIRVVVTCLWNMTPFLDCSVGIFRFCQMVVRRVLIHGFDFWVKLLSRVS